MGRSASLERARRPPPANLSLDQRLALEQFLDGQISAGALSSKLDQAEPSGPAAEPDWSPTPRAERPLTAPAPRRRLALPAVLASTLLVAGVGAYAVASASTSSEPPSRTGAAKVTAKASRRHHRVASRTDRATLISATSTGSSTAYTSATKPAHHTPPGKAHGHGHGHGQKGGPAGKPGPKPAGPRP